MDLSVIILNWNSKHYLNDCLSSILRTSPPELEKEIIVIDNGSSDGSVSYIKEAFPGIILIENSKNRGVAAARNQGVAVSKGRYILLLDVDTIIHDDAVENLIRAMEGDKSSGLCGPKLITESGELIYSCREFQTILSKLYRQLPSKWQDFFLKKEELRDWDHGCAREVGYCIGACQLIRREAFEDVGFLDSRMFYGCEEVDFCMRLWERGWKVLYDPRSVVMHVEQRIGRKNLFSRLQTQHNRSIILFFWKHKYFLRAPRIKDVIRGCNYSNAKE